MQEGELLYIRPRNSSTSGGMIMRFESSYRGEEDLSYHGSPWYENFIVCTDPVTGKSKYQRSKILYLIFEAML